MLTKDETRLLAWLSRSMVNIYHDRQRRSRDHLEPDQVELSSGDTTLEELKRKDEIQLIREAVARLPEDQRMILSRLHQPGAGGLSHQAEST